MVNSATLKWLPGTLDPFTSIIFIRGSCLIFCHIVGCINKQLTVISIKLQFNTYLLVNQNGGR